MIDEKKTVALILAQLAPTDGIEIEIEPGEVELSPEEQLQAVAGELVEATRCGDVAAVAEALRGAFLLLDSMPHVEGEHVAETEEEEAEESSDPYEAVSHELRERFGGYREAEEEGHSYGGTAGRKRYARGGMVRRYADGGMVPPGRPGAMPAPSVGDKLRMPGPVSAGPRAPELAALTSRARSIIGQAGGMPASPGVVTSAPSSMISRDALANALASRARR